MENKIKNLTGVMAIIMLTACASNEKTPNSISQWDFNHSVQFKQTDLTGGKYHIKVISKPDTQFSQLATFIMRRSLYLCKSYGYKIEVLDGIEGFYDKLSFPNLITSSLSVNIECTTPK